MNRIVLCLLLMMVISSSCVKLRDRIYFQDGRFSDSLLVNFANLQKGYRVQAKDLLGIDIYSGAVEENQPLNKTTQLGQNAAAAGTAPALYLRGYVVDALGKITVPGGIGELEVAGLTLEEIRDKVRAKVSENFKEFSVEVKLLNFNISVLGEVIRPGYYQIYQEKVTLLQGLALAGDLTRFANRHQVRLLRQREDGLEVVTLDLTKSKFLESEYFFLHPNDAIYVEPLKADIGRNNLPVLGTIFGGVSALVLIANLIVNLRK